jgi:hypothetical protein
VPFSGSSALGENWTPVHIDFQVDDFETFLAKAIKAGAKCEQKFESSSRPLSHFAATRSAMISAQWGPTMPLADMTFCTAHVRFWG